MRVGLTPTRRVNKPPDCRDWPRPAKALALPALINDSTQTTKHAVTLIWDRWGKSLITWWSLDYLKEPFHPKLNYVIIYSIYLDLNLCDFLLCNTKGNCYYCYGSYNEWGLELSSSQKDLLFLYCILNIHNILFKYI